MNIAIKELIEKVKEKCLGGEILNKEEIIKLLGISIGSEEDEYLRKTARTVAKLKTGNRAYIWTAIGADFEKCTMNCEFCSLGEKWNIITNDKVYSEEEIIEKAKKFVREGSDFIVLRTTEYYSLNKVGVLAEKIREAVPGDYHIILNTGELDAAKASYLEDCGVNGIYHALRLGEGITTPFDPYVRLATMNSVKESQLNLISLVEPIGEEHTNEELAERFLSVVEAKAYISGAMARVPVEGTPFGGTKLLNESRLAQIISVFRLSGGNVVENICVHPASSEAVAGGANVVVVETGAIPREDELVKEEWNGFSMEDAKKLFLKEGYKLNAV